MAEYDSTEDSLLEEGTDMVDPYAIEEMGGGPYPGGQTETGPVWGQGAPMPPLSRVQRRTVNGQVVGAPAPAPRAPTVNGRMVQRREPVPTGPVEGPTPRPPRVELLPPAPPIEQQVPLEYQQVPPEIQPVLPPAPRRTVNGRVEGESVPVRRRTVNGRVVN